MAKKGKRESHASPTITDVARQAGVSRTAVSYVLNENGQRNTHVSEEARAKVLQAVQELHFRPYALARALSLGQSEEIAMIMSFPLSPFPVGFITSLQQQAFLHGYTPVIYLTQGFSPKQKKELYEMIFTRRPLGLICTSFDFTEEDMARAREVGIKHIIFFSFHPESFEQTSTVVLPCQALGYLAAQHLLERGHRHLALVQPDDESQAEGFLQRLAGMREAMAGEPGTHLDILPLALSASAALSLTENSLLGFNRPTGIYAFSDEYAVALLGALTHRGIRVPQEVALIGTDNLPIGELVCPALTTIRFDVLDIGKRVADLLHAIHHNLPLAEDLTRPLVPQLIPREST